MFQHLKNFFPSPSPGSAVIDEPSEVMVEGPPTRFGAAKIVIKPDGNTSTITIIEQKQPDNTSYYVVYISSIVLSQGSYYAELITLLRTLTPASRVVIYISSPGGCLMAGAMIASAIRMSKAQVATVAIGPTASAASLIWSAARIRHAQPGSALMFHMSSHAEWGNSLAIKLRADNTVRYVKEIAIDPLVADGLLTAEEAEKIVEQRRDVWLDAATINARLEAARG